MIFVAGISLAFFLEILLLTKRNKTGPDMILAAWMFFIGLHLLLYYVYYSGNQFSFPHLIAVDMPLPLVHGPFLFLYVSALTGQMPKRRALAYIHFLPPLLMYIYLVHFFILPASGKIAVMQSGGEGYAAFSAVRRVMVLLSGVVYVALSQVVLQRHRKNIRQQFSDIGSVNLQWLQYLVAWLGFIWLVVLAFNLDFTGYIRKSALDPDLFIFSAVVAFVAFLGFFGLKQTSVFIAGTGAAAGNNTRPQGPVPAVTPLRDAEKYAKSGLKDADAEDLHKKLTGYMQTEKPFLDSGLSLSDLAERLMVHPNYLSQVINERENRNFYDYINAHRVEEFRRLAADPKKKNYTVLALAFESGFNSKSAFNSHFKRITGQTPSGFIRLPK
jgi:AraC-like DNA-binding protein